MHVGACSRPASRRHHLLRAYLPSSACMCGTAPLRYKREMGERKASADQRRLLRQEKFRESGVADRLAPVTTAASETKTLFSQVCADACARVQPEKARECNRERRENARERVDAHQSNRRRERARESLGVHESRRIQALTNLCSCGQLGSTLETSFNSQVSQCPRPVSPCVTAFRV